MSYKITYYSNNKQPATPKGSGTLMLVSLLLLAVSLFSLVQLWPVDINVLREALFPWTRESVQAAFAGFRESIVNGGSFVDSAEKLFMEIVHETGFAQ